MAVETETSTLLVELAELQSELPKLPKDKTNPHFNSKFTGLEAIVEAVTPLLLKHRLLWTTKPDRDELGPYLEYRLAHLDAHESLVGRMPLLLAKGDMQGLGSALTYARRYALVCVLNLVADEDDDGNASAPPPGTVSLQSHARGLSTDQIRAAFKTAGVTMDGSPWQALDRVREEQAQGLYAALQAAKL